MKLKNDIKKILLIFAGSLSLVLGTIGIFLPLLPTTPFLLLAAFCYLRSSQKLYDKLIDSKRFGSYIKNYMEYRAVNKKAKFSAMSILWISLIISMLLVNNIYIYLVLLAVGIGVSIHVMSLKTME